MRDRGSDDSSPRGSKDGPREQGFVEKVKDSYGFIAFANKPESLFFHFSEVMSSAYGIPVDLQAGDEVEFIQDTDRKSQKSIASCVELLQPGTIKPYTLGETVITGTVMKEARALRGDGGNFSRPGRSRQEANGLVGRISYNTDAAMGKIGFEVGGQVDPTETLRQGDVVSFCISTNRRDGRQTANEVALVERAPVNEVDGIIRSLKDGFGFIERGDVAKEIFFHYSEFSPQQEPTIGDGVRFEVVTASQDKPVAQNVRLLPPGSVNFDEVVAEERRGVVSKPLKKPRDRRVDPSKDLRNYGGIITVVAGDVGGSVDCSRGSGSASKDATDGGIGDDRGGGGGGKAIVAGSSNEMEIQYRFGVADVLQQNNLNAYMVGIGDTVSFKVAKDKRNGKERAVNVSVVETAPLPDEDREEGIIGTVKDGFGFIKCADRDARLFFHFSELLSTGQNVRINDHVNFAVEEQQQQGQQQSGGHRSSPRKGSGNAGAEKQLHAVRVKILPPGSVQFEVTSRQRFKGVVVKPAHAPRNSFDSRRNTLSSSSRGSNCSTGSAEASGVVKYVDASGEGSSAAFNSRDVTDVRSSSLRAGDEIEFNTHIVRRTGAISATQIVILKRAPASAPAGAEKVGGADANKAIVLPARLAPGDVPPPGVRHGLVSSIKEAFGFLESVACNEELFFHFSELQVKGTQLKRGDAVTFDSKRRGGKSVAVCIALLPAAKRAELETVGDEILSGVITRNVRGSSKKYNGTIEYADLNAVPAEGLGKGLGVGREAGCGESGHGSGTSTVGTGSRAADSSNRSSTRGSSSGDRDGDGSAGGVGTGTGMSAESIHARLDAACAKEGSASSDPRQDSLAAGRAAGASKRLSAVFGTSCLAEGQAALRVGHEVTFRIAVWNGGESTRAVDVRNVNPGPRKTKAQSLYVMSEETFTAPIDSVKGQFGFIAHKVEASGSDSLYYHGSSVVSNAELGAGDVVEFAVSHHVARGKYTAVNVKLVRRREDQPAAPRPKHMRSKLLLPNAAETMLPNFGPIRQPSLPTPGARGFDSDVRSCTSQYMVGETDPPLLTADAPEFFMPVAT